MKVVFQCSGSEWNRRGQECRVVGCRGRAVRITGLNGLERPHIGTQHLQMRESEEFKSGCEGGLLSETAKSVRVI